MNNQASVVLLACGSFNPVTNMHLRLFEVARDTLNQSGNVHVIGGIISPVNDKYNKKDLVAGKHRCRMVDLAVQTSDWIRCDAWESQQNSWQETVKVLRHHQSVLDSLLSENVPSNMKKQKLDLMNAANICNRLSSNWDQTRPILVKLLCGADLLESFAVPGLWKENDISEIVGKFGMVVVTREGTNPFRFIYESDILTKHQNNIVIVNEWIANDISSTSVRRALKRDLSVKYLLQDSVIQYIREHSLYDSSEKNFLARRHKEGAAKKANKPPTQKIYALRTGKTSKSNRTFPAGKIKRATRREK